MSNGKQCGNCVNNSITGICKKGKTHAKICLGGNDMHTLWQTDGEGRTDKHCATCSHAKIHTGVLCVVRHTCLYQESPYTEYQEISVPEPENATKGVVPRSCVSCATSLSQTGVPCAHFKSCVYGSFWTPTTITAEKINALAEELLNTAKKGSIFELKNDEGKPDMSLLEMVPNALRAFCTLSEFGAKKYDRSSWIDVPNARRRYTAAMWRHYFQEGPDAAPASDTGKGGSGMEHDIICMWNAIIRVECRLRGLPLGEDTE